MVGVGAGSVNTSAGFRLVVWGLDLDELPGYFGLLRG